MQSLVHRPLLSRVAALAAAALAIAVAFVAGVAAPAHANSPGSSMYTSTSSNDFLAYSRVIRLAHSGSANGTLLGTFEHADKSGAATTFAIRQSTDDGATWSTKSSLSDPLTGAGHPSSQLWQPFLYEFPQALGAYPAGTLLLVGNVAPTANTSTTFVEWRSTDAGATWTYVSAFQAGGGEGTGIWEPFLALDSSGKLNCYFSDERQSGTYSQKLAHIVSTDGGVTWSANADGSTRVSPGEVNDVASTTQSDRPGMATVAVSTSGTYVMAYEVCGPAFNCVARVKSSTTGDTWGTGPADLGTTATTRDGRQLFHSPYLAWSPAGGGEFLLAGQTESGGSEGGQVVFVNSSGNATGSWSWIPAPVATTGSASNCSVDYSPDLLVSASGQTVRYTAPSAVGPNGCEEVTGETNAGVLPFRSTFSGGDSGWVDYNGCWSTSGDVYAETCGGTAGPKAVAGSTAWTDYTVQGDVRIDSGTQAGLLLRVSNPSAGTDALTGYYLGITTTGLVLGRENSGWTSLSSAVLPGGVTTGTWYHLVAQASGCTFTVSAVPVGSTAAPTAFTYTDSGCALTSGAVGVRDQGSTASFRNIAVTAGATASTAVAPYAAPFASGSASGWTTYGGTWSTTASTETYADSAGGSGDKSVAGSTSWGNYSLTGDVRLDSLGGNANAGFIVRVTNPAVGADALDGYYAGVTPTGLVLGRQLNNWTQLASAALPVTLPTGTWYHLTVEAVGCTITVTGQPANGGSIVSAGTTDTGCSPTSGAIGVRTYNAGATWKDVAVTPR
jgi:hypothetical protein